MQPRSFSASADFRALEADLDAVNFLHAAGNRPGGEVEFVRYFDPVNVDNRVVTTLRKNVDQHGERERVIEYRIFRIDMRDAGDRVTENDRYDLFFDERGDLGEQRAVLEFVAVEPAHHLLASVNDR